MAQIKSLAALLCAAAAIAACASPAAAVLLCKDQEIQLAVGNQIGGCNSATLAQDSIVTASSPTNSSLTTLEWDGPQPQIVQIGSITNFVFLGGVEYSYTAKNTNETDCTGTVNILPCQAVCRDLELTVNATSNNDPCTKTIGAALFSEVDFIDDASVGNAATNYSITAFSTGKLAPMGQKYPVGRHTTVQAQIVYPNGKSAVSDPCTVVIRDVSPNNAPVIDTTANCYYSNNTGSSNYRIALSRFAKLPSGNRCARQRLFATQCAPVKRQRICLPQTQPAALASPTPVNSLDVFRGNARAKQELTVTVQVADIFGARGPTAQATINVYKSKGLVPRAARATCVPVNAKI